MDVHVYLHHDKRLDTIIDLLRGLTRTEKQMSGDLKALSAQLVQRAKDEDDAFVAMNAAGEARAARLKAQIDKLTALGTNIPPEIIAELQGVEASMSGTLGKMVNAAILANTDAAGDVPADVASTVPA